MSIKQKFLTIIMAIFIALPLFSSAQSTDQSTLIQQLQRQIEELTQKIQALQQQLGTVQSELGAPAESSTSIQTGKPALTPESEPESTPPDFTRTLFRGSSGDDVRKLQEFLKKDKEIYPDGLITGYFGPKTEEALKKWQTKHNIEAVGILGPQTRARFQELGHGRIQELITEGAGASGNIPSGLEKKLEVTTTSSSTTITIPPISTENFCPKDPSKCYTEKECKAANFYWWKLVCNSNPAPSGTCASSYNYCINSDECSNSGFYWCRNSCYPNVDACQGQTYISPATPAVSATPATPAQPIEQTGTTTVSAIPATPAVPAVIVTSTTTGDTTPPVISNIQAIPNTQTDPLLVAVVISWTTNELADSEVEYGITTAYGSTNGLATSLFTNQTRSVIFSKAGTATTYHYRVKSKDAAGNLAVSSDNTFVTAVTAVPPSGFLVVGFVSDAAKLKNPWSVAVSGNYAYVTSNGASSGFSVVDVSNPVSPVVRGSLSDSRLSDATAVAVSGNYAYVAAAGASGISIIDISNPDSPKIVGSLSHSSMNRAWSLVVSGNRAYVAGLYASSIAVVNISNPTNPTLEGYASVPSPQTISISGNYAYVGASYSNRIYSFDISSTTPQLISSIDDLRLRESWGSYAVGNYLYTTSAVDDHFTIVDISNPANMKVVGTIQDSTNLDGAYGVVVVGRYAYVPAAFANRLTVVDVLDPANPKIVNSIKDDDKFNQPTAVAVSGNYAYVPARYKSGLAIVDISKATLVLNTLNSWRLAQILESLKGILNSLKLLR